MEHMMTFQILSKTPYNPLFCEKFTQDRVNMMVRFVDHEDPF